MRRFTFILFSIYFFFLFSPKNVSAAFSLSIPGIDPTSVSSSEQEVAVSVNISDLPSESYFRVEWQQSSGSQYFGYTKNNDGSWIKVATSEDCKNYYKVSDLTTTSFTLSTKIGSDNAPASNGQYLLKVRRYTAGCSTTDSEPVSIQINLPTPTPQPTNTPAPTDSPAPSKTPTPTKKPTSTPSKAITPTATPEDTKVEVADSNNIETTASITPILTQQVLGQSTSKTPFIFIGLGSIFLVVVGILAYFQFGDKIFIWKKKTL